MNAQITKFWSVFTINNILTVIFVAYIGNAVKGLYLSSVVPVADADLPQEMRVRSHMSPGQPFHLQFFLTLDPARQLTSSFYIGNISNAEYSEGFSEESVIGSSDDLGKLTVTNLELPSSFCSNRTIYLQVLAVSDTRDVLNYRTHALSQYLIPLEERDSKHFLLDTSYDDSLIVEPFASVPPEIEVGVVLETREMDMQQLLMKGLGRNIDGRQKTIHFPLHVNPYVTPRDEYVSLASCERITLTIKYKPVGMSYWLLSENLIRSFDNLEHNMNVNEYDIDSFKMLITGSSILKLTVVYVVSLLHFVFEYLSIKSDLSFWRSKTKFDGISESSISMNVVMGGISALYVVEQGESQIALYFILIKMAMNLWKIYKLRKSEGAEKGSLLDAINQEEKKCMKWLMLVLTPLILAFCAYRLVYHKFRSWYSWAILSLTAASEVFGFVTMTPQVFMNYRLKSVEHLPWSALTYSFINTFIDDLFAFGIFRVPEVSRYSCLRDDIVFVIICFQRWYYKERRVEEVEEEKVEPPLDPVVETTSLKERKSTGKVVGPISRAKRHNEQ